MDDILFHVVWVIMIVGTVPLAYVSYKFYQRLHQLRVGEAGYRSRGGLSKALGGARFIMGKGHASVGDHTVGKYGAWLRLIMIVYLTLWALIGIRTLL